MSSVFACDACQLVCTTKSTWHWHLTDYTHCTNGRVLKKWGRPEVKQACIVVYSTLHIRAGQGEEGDRLIQYFSSKCPSGFVVDFVFWRMRPLIAIIQFESRLVVREVLSGGGRNAAGMELDLGHQKVLVKRGEAISNTEWFALLPPGYSRSLEFPSRLFELQKVRALVVRAQSLVPVLGRAVSVDEGIADVGISRPNKIRKLSTAPGLEAEAQKKEDKSE